MGEVSRLFVAIVHRQPMREMQEVLAVPDHGLDGCTHARPGGRRQVLLMDAETLDPFGLSPGVVKENITTRGLALGELRAGQRLRLGEAFWRPPFLASPAIAWTRSVRGSSRSYAGVAGCFAGSWRVGGSSRGTRSKFLTECQGMTESEEP